MEIITWKCHAEEKDQKEGSKPRNAMVFQPRLRREKALVD
jgi:hypothetical protein